jgi:hypothetical protein
LASCVAAAESNADAAWLLGNGMPADVGGGAAVRRRRRRGGRGVPHHGMPHRARLFLAVYDQIKLRNAI